MIVDSGLVSAVTQSTRALVLAELQKTEREYGAVAMDVPSQSDSENYRWLKAIRGIAEWLTTRVVRNLETEGFRIPNRAFEQTIAIKTEDLRRDKLGLYRPLLQEMGRAAAVFPDELIAEVIAAGHETLCFDGQYFFDTDHPVGTGVVSNKLSLALSADNYGTVRTAMKKQTDEFGKRLKVKPTHLFHATNLEGLARQIVTAEKIGGNDNIHRGTAELLKSPTCPTACGVSSTSAGPSSRSSCRPRSRSSSTPSARKAGTRTPTCTPS
jgi:phage major head subunit gpT-like protein